MVTLSEDGLVGRTVDGRYDVLTHIADGGMGSVYAALDTRLDRQVALKIMRPELARDDAFVARFRREARSAARLSHPGVVAVFDQGEDDGVLFLAMEFVDGHTLRDLLSEKGALTPREALDITASVLAALQAAHRRGILHRDIKPENVLVATDGHVKVADFGLARAMGTTTATGRTGPLLGTVAYLAPEQVEHGTSDQRTDLYAVGLLLHEMLTGRTAVEGDSPIHIAWQHVNGSLTRPSQQVEHLCPALDDLVAHATGCNPDERFPDAATFLAALDTTRSTMSDADLDRRPPADSEPRTDTLHAPGGPVRRHTSPISRRTATLPRLHAPHSPTPEPGRRHRRGRSVWIAAVLVVLLLTGGGAAYWWFGPPGDRTVPQLVSIEQVEAERLLHDVDLVPVTDQAFSETVARGTVISSDTAPGTVLHRGSRVTVVVSKGPERYDVPDVVGRTVEEATGLITSNHLKVAPGRRAVYDEKVPTGRVVSTEPAAGTSSKPGAPVALILSKGRQPIPLDDIAGRPLDEARATLEKAGLTVQIAPEREYHSKVPDGSIISTSPTGPVHRGDTVTLVVSKGPELVAIPQVQGRTAEEAAAILKQAGFEVRINRIMGGVFGTARSTDPAGGTAPKGSVVVLNVV